MFHVKQNIKQLFLEAGHNLSDHQIRQFRAYSEEILKWNRKINLTGAKSKGEIIPHILVSLSFQEFLGSSPNARILDWGAGAGFPGIPLKISSPGYKMDFMDSRSKRVSFLKNVTRKLELQETNCYLCRGEDLKDKLPSGFIYDFIVSRAAGSLIEIVRSSFNLMAPKGSWVVLKGRNKASETDEILRFYKDKIDVTTSGISEHKILGRDYIFVVMKKW